MTVSYIRLRIVCLPKASWLLDFRDNKGLKLNGPVAFDASATVIVFDASATVMRPFDFFVPLTRLVANV